MAGRIALLIIGLLLISSVLAGDSPATTQADKDSFIVKRGTIHPRIDVEGYFEPVDPFEVRFRPLAYAGEMKVTSVAAHGAMVKKDDLLLAVDDTEIKQQIATAQGDLANAQAQLAKAQADVSLGEIGDALAMKMQEHELDHAKGALKWFDDVDGKQMITNAEMQTRTSKAAVEDQQDELDQLKKMYKTEELTNATADIVVKRALRNLELGKIGETMAEERESKTKQFDFDYERQKLLFAIDQQTDSLDQLKASQAQSQVTRKTSLDSAKQAVEKAQKKFDDLKTDLASFTVKAPGDGVVYYGQFVNGGWQNSGPRAIEIGDKLTYSQVLMTEVVPGKLRVKADIPESRLTWIEAGAKARIVPLSNPQAATDGTCGQIIPVGAAHENGEGFAMAVELASVDQHLSPGEKASVQIDLPEVKDALIVPPGDVHHARVQIKSGDDKTEWRDVTTGFSDEKNVEIKSGLKEGDTLEAEK